VEEVTEEEEVEVVDHIKVAAEEKEGIMEEDIVEDIAEEEEETITEEVAEEEKTITWFAMELTFQMQLERLATMNGMRYQLMQETEFTMREKEKGNAQIMVQTIMNRETSLQWKMQNMKKLTQRIQMKVMHMDELLDSDEEHTVDVVVMVEEEDDLKLRDADYILHKYTKTKGRESINIQESETNTNTKYQHFHSFINIFRFHRSKQE
jgi:hypothetical protein